MSVLLQQLSRKVYTCGLFFIHTHSYKWTVKGKKVAQNYEKSKESSLNVYTKYDIYVQTPYTWCL